MSYDPQDVYCSVNQHNYAELLVDTFIVAEKYIFYIHFLLLW